MKRNDCVRRGGREEKKTRSPHFIQRQHTTTTAPKLDFSRPQYFTLRKKVASLLLISFYLCANKLPGPWYNNKVYRPPPKILRSQCTTSKFWQL